MARPLPGAVPSSQRAKQKYMLSTGWLAPKNKRKEGDELCNTVLPHKVTNQTNHHSLLGVRPPNAIHVEASPNEAKTREEASTLNTLSVSVQPEKQNHLSFLVQRPFNTGNWFHRRQKSLNSQPKNNQATNKLPISGSHCHPQKDEVMLLKPAGLLTQKNLKAQQASPLGLKLWKDKENCPCT